MGVSRNETQTVFQSLKIVGSWRSLVARLICNDFFLSKRKNSTRKKRSSTKNQEAVGSKAHAPQRRRG
ncbi:hypothetical protein AUJ15_03075 [Candidatus Micrarchaeota archaeon CG1_02_55_41]|nr:MAG: hypothetical protein AUJ15_03075 [Candidatus Micrarchaeota archaeon CG1_02_55_41]